MAYLGNPAYDSCFGKTWFAFFRKIRAEFSYRQNILERLWTRRRSGRTTWFWRSARVSGSMTQYLCERAREVITVEIDDKLIPVLADTLSEYDNVTVIHEDILKVDIRALAEEKNGGRPVKVVANLPYYITAHYHGNSSSRVPLESVTVMVQKEVADG